MVSQRWPRRLPPKNQPWYHVLVHGADHTTYVAEQNLAPPIREQLLLTTRSYQIFLTVFRAGHTTPTYYQAMTAFFGERKSPVAATL